MNKREEDVDSLCSEDGQFSDVVADMSKWQRQMYKKDDRYLKVSKAVSRDNTEQFEGHFREYEEIVDASIRIYTSEGFRGTIFSIGAMGVAPGEKQGASIDPSKKVTPEA